jgi:hypothetical protein
VVKSKDCSSTSEIISRNNRIKPLNDLKELQRKIDLDSFRIKDKCYSELEAIDILKHNCFHLVNLAAKVSSVCEKEEHSIDVSKQQIINEVIPDLIIYALQFANIFDVDLDNKYQERIEFVKTKLSRLT